MVLAHTGSPYTDAEERPDMTERHIPIEISVATDPDERPCVDSGTRVDVSVNGQLYPTSRLEDGRYVAWWFDTDPPEPGDPATTEWVAAPTRFLAAGTLHELWEDPAAFDDLVESDSDPDTETDTEIDSGTEPRNEPVETPSPPKPSR